MKIKKYTNGAWTDLDKPVKKYGTYTDEATTLPLTIQTSATDAVENYQVYGASGGVGEQTENLFDYTAQDPNNGFVDNKYIRTSSERVDNENWCISEYIPVIAGKTYNFLWSTTDFSANLPSIVFYSGSKVPLSTAQNIAYSNRLSFKFTVPAGAQYIRASILKAQQTNAYLKRGLYKIPLLNTSGVTENLLNPENVEKGRIDNGVVGYSNGTSALTWDNSTNRINYTTTSNYRGFVTEVFDVVPNSYYALNYTPGDETTTRIAFYNSSDEWLNEDIIVYSSQLRPVTITIPNDASKMRIAFVATNSGNHYIEIPMLTKGSTPPDHYIPHRYTSNYDLMLGDSKLYEDEYLDFESQKVYKYVDGVLTPQDPPTPFPALTTYIGENSLSVDTTVQPEKVVCEYKGWKPAGDGEVKYYHNGWVNTPPPTKPDWLTDGYEAKLDALTAPSDYYCDLAYIENNTQMVYRVYVSSDTVCQIEHPDNYISVLQNPYSSSFRGFTTYGVRYNNGVWNVAITTTNQDRGQTAYASIATQRAILKSTITSLTNTSGLTFEDYR